MFNWGQSLYHALRAATLGGFALVALIILAALAGADFKGGGRADSFLAGCLLIGFVRLGWDAWTKKYPDA